MNSLSARVHDAELPPVVAVAMVYLALPTLLFVTGWIRWEYAVPLALLLFMALRAALHGIRFEFSWPKGQALAAVGVLAAVAILWSGFGGAGHFVYANTDWITRDAVLRDLSSTGWPPSYGAFDDRPLILRAPVGFYLPAALLAKVFGSGMADIFLFLWTALGVYIFFWIAVPVRAISWRLLWAVLIVVLFSGMDIVGAVMRLHHWPAVGQHIEWWAQAYQYSSNTTALFWVPNHLLPGWLGAALLYRYGMQSNVVRLVPALAATTPLWSPLAAFGLLPFFALVVWRHRASVRHMATVMNVLPAFGIALLVSRYLLMDPGLMEAAQLEARSAGWWHDTVQYLLFVVLEFGLVALLLLRLRFSSEVVVATFVLITLPFFHFGPGNDLVMRGGIAALTMLCLAGIDAFSIDSARSERRTASVALVIILAVGAFTPLQEFERAIIRPAWQPGQGNLVEISGGVPPHYIARITLPAFRWIFNSPSEIPYNVLPDDRPQPLPPMDEEENHRASSGNDKGL